MFVSKERLLKTNDNNNNKPLEVPRVKSNKVVLKKVTVVLNRVVKEDFIEKMTCK